MKKSLFKILSMACAVSIICTSCPSLAVMAEGELETLTAEKLAISNGVNQIPTSIVSNLTLPEITGVTWESSNPNVLANDGTVARPMIENADVTLTAKTATESKTFSYTVKARTTNVLHQDSFAYSDRYALFPNVSSGTRWNITGGTDTVSTIMTDSSGNKYATFDFTASSNATKRKILTEAIGETLYLSFDIKPDIAGAPYVAVRVDGTNQNGSAVNYNLRLVNFNKGTARAANYENSIANYGKYDGTKFVNICARLDLANQKFYVSFDNGAEVGPFTFAAQRDSGSTIDSLNVKSFNRIGVVSFLGSSSGMLDIDNFSISTAVGVSELLSSLSDTEKVQYVRNRITKASLTNETSGGITQNLDLDGGYYDLSSVANVKWTSSNPGIAISDDGNTAVVTQQAMPQSGVLTATITSGDITDTVKFPFTVAPAATHQLMNGAIDEDFEKYKEGVEISWAPQYTQTKGTAVYDGASDNVVGQFVRNSDNDTSKIYAWRLYNTNGGTQKWTERYMISLDMQYTPGADNSLVYVRQMGVVGFNYVGFDYANREVILGSRSYGHSTDKRYKMRDDANLQFENNEWIHIDIDFNAAKRETITYVNGIAVTDTPMEINDAYINSDYLMPMRGIDIALNGYGTVKVDNVSVRAYDAPAEAYDENSDFTVQKFALSNQGGESIRNIGANTTMIKATLRVTANRTPVLGDVKMFLAVYDRNGKLYKTTSADVKMGTYGYDIVTAEIPLDGDCSGYNAKAFLWYDGKITPVTDNQALDKEIVFDKGLFDKTVNYSTAKSLGYGEYESTQSSNIQAIFFDGEDYLGQPTKHFAYFGVPEGASESSPVPAVVLVHGGGGTAFDEWVKIWNDKGYAAIAMDMNGSLPNQRRDRHAWAGASNEHYGAQKLVDASKDLWMYQAVTEVVLAHNLLIQDKRIDSDKIGIAGISWGGIITSTSIGVDTRFAFAVPVYGCGYLYEMDSYMGWIIDDEMLDWDPSRFIAKANKNMPTLWINGDLDGNFAIDGFSKSAELMGDKMNLVIKPNMSHGHQAGYWVSRVPEVYSFADSVVKGTSSLMKVSSPVIDGNNVVVTVSGSAANKGILYYTESEKLLYDDANGTIPEYSFTAVTGESSDGETWSFTLPEVAKKFYVTFDYYLNGVTHQASTKFVSLN